MYLARNGVIGRLGGVKIALTSLSARPVARFMNFLRLLSAAA
jgi:hypothetical protein